MFQWSIFPAPIRGSFIFWLCFLCCTSQRQGFPHGNSTCVDWWVTSVAITFSTGIQQWSYLWTWKPFQNQHGKINGQKNRYGMVRVKKWVPIQLLGTYFDPDLSVMGKNSEGPSSRRTNRHFAKYRLPKYRANHARYRSIGLSMLIRTLWQQSSSTAGSRWNTACTWYFSSLAHESGAGYHEWMDWWVSETGMHQ